MSAKCLLHLIVGQPSDAKCQPLIANMPELPEVETIARGLRPDLVDRRILSADIFWSRTIASPAPNKFKELVRNKQITGVSRRAKFLILELETYNLLIHLRMSGDLAVRKGKIKPEKHDRVLLNLSDGRQLVFNDPRKFGRIWLVDDTHSVLGRLGPEPFEKEFTSEWLYASLHARRRRLKPLLLDQTFLAGLGNIYADECLNLAKLHPLRMSNTVRPVQAQALHDAIRSVLKEGIRRNGASIDWVYRGGEYQNHFRVYDRSGEPCPACGTAIKKLIVGQRGTHLCPSCQKLR